MAKPGLADFLGLHAICTTRGHSLGKILGPSLSGTIRRELALKPVPRPCPSRMESWPHVSRPALPQAAGVEDEQTSFSQQQFFPALRGDRQWSRTDSILFHRSCLVVHRGAWVSRALRGSVGAPTAVCGIVYVGKRFHHPHSSLTKEFYGHNFLDNLDTNFMDTISS